MDIAPLKEKLGDETFARLKEHIDVITSQRDEARSESITGRKGLKDKVATLEAAQSKLLGKLGIDSLDDIDTMPDAKGAADAVKQFEAKVKRLERENADLVKERDGAKAQFRGGLQRVAIADALAGHEFVARDLVESYVSAKLTWEGDELFFKADDGKLLSVKDGVAGVAKTRPELLKAAGAGGAGVRTSNVGSGWQKAGDMGGDRAARVAAIAAKFPDLAAG